ncbi:MAG: PQQ-binding-like beta-propeller repeat protein [Ignavibacterium album]|uniref:outer membrane protein assembly factor BamB family protein n=1 Tax=Ignavibacterium album TaxID=591197 RepID=UPI0026ED9766|nr:PQQ-binding-like beta-propeller repeat protein [Ignavibacterium album]MCX8104947.1 PQQ-binding-like beta-propeller repeat protein [Ignavibacterium album]
MKKFFVLVLLLFTPLYSQQFRFAWLTDIHIGYPTAEEDLITSVNDINSLDEIDFIIVSGDITATGTLQELSKAKSILDKLKKPYYIIPGNHDTKWSESGCTDFIKLWGNDRFTFEYKNYLFVGLHQGPRMRMADGHFAPEDLRWFDSLFKTKSDSIKQLIFITHYPLDESIANWYEMTDRLKSLNTKLVLCGHGHQNKPVLFEGIKGVMGRSNLSSNNDNGAYNIVEFQDDSVFFFEKNNSNDKKYLWHSLSLSEKNILPEKVTRPDYSINTSYPNIRIKWQFNTRFTIGSSAVVSNEKVYVGDASGKFYCFNVDDGSVNWTFISNNAIYSTPAVEKNYVVFGSTDSTVYCLNSENGKLIWKYRTNAAVVASPLISNDVVYIGSSDRQFLAIDLHSGKLEWSFNQLNGFVETRPTIYENKIIFGAWDEHLYCLDADDGKLLWKWKGDKTGIFYSPAVCIPVVSNDIVFIVAPDRKMTAIDINSGNEIWKTDKYQVRETIGISEQGDNIFIRTMNDTILALIASKELSEPLWITKCGFGYDISSAQIVEKDGVIFYPTKNGVIYSLDSSNGKILWKHKISNGFINTLTVIDKNHIIATDFDGNVTCLIAEN